MPLVSVVMAVHNDEAYLGAALASILGQSYTDFEFIIIDDASSDESAAMLARAAASDGRIKLLHNPQNLGLTPSLNKALSVARGPYIARQDADDLSLPGRLAEQTALLESSPGVVLACSHLQFINAEGELLGDLRRAHDPRLIRWRMSFYNHLGGHSGVMFRREAAQSLGYYDETRRYSQDYHLWLRLLSLGEAAIIPRPLCQIRRHAGQISQQQRGPQEDQSLSDSAQALQALCGLQPGLEDMAWLRAFFLDPFPPIQTAPFIHHNLQQAARALALRYNIPYSVLAEDIAERWALWLRSVPLSKQAGDKLRLARYLAAWSPQRLGGELKFALQARRRP